MNMADGALKKGGLVGAAGGAIVGGIIVAVTAPVALTGVAIVLGVAAVGAVIGWISGK
jgi:hypothetical protein